MQSKIAAVEAYLDGLDKKDLSPAPLADRVKYQNPLSGVPIEGKHNVIRFLEQTFLPAHQKARVVRHIVQEDHIATLWEAETSFGVVTIFQLFCVEDELITELRSFYDPREYLESMGKGR